MENMEILVGEQQQEAMDLPPGFRFHPTDEELITNYLYPKVLDNNFTPRAIGEVDLNKNEPWELPRQAKMGEKEWYFFCVRDRKYPTGLRTNRATDAGYWKATGKDKDIFRDKSLVGMKKTLVFYKGRAPKGEKSNWVMHEYRLDGPASLQNLPSNARNEWTICRVFQKNEAGKKIPFPGSNQSESLPPLMESSPYNITTTTTNNGVAHVSCFSNPMEISTNTSQTSHYNNPNPLPYNGLINNPFQSIPSNPGDNYVPRISCGNSYFQPQMSNFQENYPMSDQNILRGILENYNHGTNVKPGMKTEEVNYSASQDTGLSSDMNAEISSVGPSYVVSRRPFDDYGGPSTSRGPVDLENLWNY